MIGVVVPRRVVPAEQWMLYMLSQQVRALLAVSAQLRLVLLALWAYQQYSYAGWYLPVVLL